MCSALLLFLLSCASRQAPDLASSWMMPAWLFWRREHERRHGVYGGRIHVRAQLDQLLGGGNAAGPARHVQRRALQFVHRVDRALVCGGKRLDGGHVAVASGVVHGGVEGCGGGAGVGRGWRR